MALGNRRLVLPINGYWFSGTDEERMQRAHDYLDREEHIANDLEPWVPKLVASAVKGRYDRIGSKPFGRLALIMTLSVSPRMLWGGTPQAFVGDLAAQGHLLQAIAAGQDRQLGFIERLYLYQPFVQSEDFNMHERALKLYTLLKDNAQDEELAIAHRFLQDAHDRHALVKRFGRFPARNEMLKRPSRQEEKMFLMATDAPGPELALLRADVV